MKKDEQYRYFTHTDKFISPLVYVEVDTRNDSSFLVERDGSVRDHVSPRGLEFCLKIVRAGYWKEITGEEADKLTNVKRIENRNKTMKTKDYYIKLFEKVGVSCSSPSEFLCAAILLSKLTELPINKSDKPLLLDFEESGKTFNPFGCVSCFAGYVLLSLKSVTFDKVIPFKDLHRFINGNQEIEVKLNDQYTAVVTKEQIKVGCQTFPVSKIKELTDAVNKLYN